MRAKMIFATLLVSAFLTGVVVYVVYLGYTYGYAEGKREWDQDVPQRKDFPKRVGEGGHNIAIGWKAGLKLTKESHCILLGDKAEANDSHQLVIQWTDGTELRQALPKDKTVDLRRFMEWVEQFTSKASTFTRRMEYERR